MEGDLSFFEFDGDRVFHGGHLLGGEDFADSVHVACQAGDGKQVPVVAAGNVLEASVINFGIFKGDPAGEVGHRLGAGPIRIVLVPGDHPAMPGGFAEELVVPEVDRAAYKLAGWDSDGRVPDQVMKRGGDTPSAQGVEKDAVGIGRFVGVEFVEEVVSGVFGVHDSGQFLNQTIGLFFCKAAHSGDIAKIMEVFDLFGSEQEGVVLGGGHFVEEIGDWSGKLRKVFGYRSGGHLGALKMGLEA